MISLFLYIPFSITIHDMYIATVMNAYSCSQVTSKSLKCVELLLRNVQNSFSSHKED